MSVQPFQFGSQEEATQYVKEEIKRLLRSGRYNIVPPGSGEINIGLALIDFDVKDGFTTVVLKVSGLSPEMDGVDTNGKKAVVGNAKRLNYHPEHDNHNEQIAASVALGRALDRLETFLS